MSERVDNSSDIPVLKEVTNELGTFGNWYPLGIQLNLAHPVLNAIKQDECSTQMCCIMMVTKWFDSTSRPSWSELCRALRDMKEYALAERIAKKYCPEMCAESQQPQPPIPHDQQQQAGNDPSVERQLPQIPKDDDDVSKKKEFDVAVEFAYMFSTVVELLDETVNVKTMKRFLKSLRQRRTELLYISPELYEYCTTTAEVLESLQPQLINSMNLYLLKKIVGKFGCDEAKELVRQYDANFPRDLPLNQLEDSLTDEDIEACIGTKKLKLAINRDSNRVTKRDVEEYQEGIAQNTGIPPEVISFANSRPGSVVLTFLIPECTTEAFVNLSVETLLFLSGSGVVRIEVDGVVCDVLGRLDQIVGVEERPAHYLKAKMASKSTAHQAQRTASFPPLQHTTGKRDGDIPWGEELNMRNLLNAPAIVKVVDWKYVGLELGVEEHELEIIDRECRGRINDCKRRMFSYWLKNGLELTWEEVSRAVKTVGKRLEEDRRRQQSKASIEVEENKAQSSISQLQISLKKLDATNVEIAKQQTRLEDKLLQLKEKQKQTLESSKVKWEKEDRDWEEGEEIRQNARAALRARRNFQANWFVRAFLREKGLPANLPEEEVECHLRKDLVEKQVARSRQLRSRRQLAQKHKRNLRQLLDDINEWKELTEKRITKVYADILDRREEVGLKPEKLNDLKRHLEKLNVTLKECAAAVSECDKALAEREGDFRDCENELKVFAGPFSEVVTGMQKALENLRRITKEIEKEESDLSKAVFGAVVGGLAGTAVFPVVGTAVGAVVGWYVGATQKRTVKEELEILQRKRTAKERTLRSCRETEERAHNELDLLRKLFG